MKRYGSIIGLRDENIAEYRKLHAAVWPVVAGAIASFTRAARSTCACSNTKFLPVSVQLTHMNTNIPSIVIASALLSCTASLHGAQGPYEPQWQSLARHAVPRWYEDAKFGIYFHWGPYSVPAFGSEWYSRNMYQNGPANKFHVEKYGPLDKFGYKDFIPLFTADKFNADEWAELFEKAGARFAGPVAEHADGFALWDSEVNPWNAAKMGPKQDLVGKLETAIRK